jgi:hypothetical protein
MYSFNTSFCTGQLATRDALLFPCHDVHRQQNGSRSVDRHRRRDAVERNVLEQALQIFDGIDGNTDPSNFSLGHRVVRVVPHLSGKIERRRESHLSSSQ